MTRTQAIAIIEKALPSADEATLAAAAELFKAAAAEPSVLPRALTARELALIKQSQEDFSQGRTLSSAEARASIDEALFGLGVPKSTA
jgi:collagenase-like PrtC family protease